MDHSEIEPASLALSQKVLLDLQVHTQSPSSSLPFSLPSLPSSPSSAGERGQRLQPRETAQLFGHCIHNHPRFVCSQSACFALLLTCTHGKPAVVDRAPKEFSAAQQEQLYSAAKRAGHLTELLHESEANCVRLAEQAKLLKEEIRRLGNGV